MKKARKLQLFITMVITGFGAVPIAAQTTAFTYQGKLTEDGNPANGAYDIQFKLFDTVTVGTGTQQGATLTNPTVQVTSGIFAVNLDFGTDVFTGAARFLEISVRPAGSTNPYAVLAPRQPITSSPYAIQTVNAQQLGGLPATRYVATDANGNVGIGTATPSTKLELVDPVRQLRFGPTTADNGGYLISTVPHQAIIIGGAKWDAPNWIARDTVASMTAHQFGAIEFYTNSGLTEGNLFSPAQRMVIEANGNVGIGTPSAAPGYKVDINSNGGGVRSFYNGSTHFVAETMGGTNAWAKYIMKTPNRQWAMGTSQNFNGDQLYIADETAGQIRMAITTNGNVGIGTTDPTSAKLHVEGGSTDGVYGASTTGNGVYGTSTTGVGVRGISLDGFGVYGFSTSSTGVAGASTNGIGVRGQSTNAIGVYGVSINSFAGYFQGNVHVTGTMTQGSDARLKQNISKLGYGLSEVLRLRSVSWRWKEHPERGPQLGLVAQEVEPVLPELVSTAKDGEQLKGLNYTGLVPVLVNAIQQQQAQIQKQEHEIRRLTRLVCLDHPKAALCRKAR